MLLMETKNPTPEQMMAMFKSTNNELSFKHHNEVLAYGTKNMINGQEYYIYVQKDTSGQKSAIANSAILIWIGFLVKPTAPEAIPSGSPMLSTSTT